MVFCTFAAFFLSFGATLTPAFAAYASYAPDADSSAAGLTTQGFNASFGVYRLPLLTQGINPADTMLP